MKLNKSVSEFIAECKSIENEIWNDYINPEGKCEPIIDGIVNVTDYLNATKRLLWILKEPYDGVENNEVSGGGWHFGNDFLGLDDFYNRIGRSHSTWYPILYSTYGILNNFMQYNDMPEIGNDINISRVIRQIAIINVKKLPGLTRTVDFGPIAKAYNDHTELLHKQIETYDPDIIIGGSTLFLFYNELGLKKQNEKVYGCLEYYEKGNKLYISAYHPAQTSVKRNVYVNDIVNLVKIWSTKLLQANNQFQ